MSGIEFHAIVKNGTIDIPEEYRNKIQDEVHVIILFDESENLYPNLVDQLLEHPLECHSFHPLDHEEIYERE